jgi:hypothetical protein
MGATLMAGALIRLKIGQFNKIASSKGWASTTASSKAIGCEVSTLSRILKGERACGGDFIANLLAAAAPWDFNDLFEVETGDEA